MGDYTDYILEKGPLTCGNAEKRRLLEVTTKVTTFVVR